MRGKADIFDAPMSGVLESDRSSTSVLLREEY